MKGIHWLGDSLKVVRDFPDPARSRIGFQLDRVQRGLAPNDSKAMPSIGRGVEEIRVWDGSGTFRVIYTARIADAVYILHAFQKKTQATSRPDVELAKQRLSDLEAKLRGKP